eukprot:scaffold3905_cov246-Pinguiococcus_pyrenoidosus.AAC.1
MPRKCCVITGASAARGLADVRITTRTGPEAKRISSLLFFGHRRGLETVTYGWVLRSLPNLGRARRTARAVQAGRQEIHPSDGRLLPPATLRNVGQVSMKGLQQRSCCRRLGL